MINFYQVGSAWVVNNLYLKPGSCYCAITNDNTKVSIRLYGNGHQVLYEEIANLQNENGVAYNLSTFQTAINKFAGEDGVSYASVSAELTRPANTDNYTALDGINSVATAVKQVSVVTLTGAGGTANITEAGGLTKLVTFNTTLAQTATDFATDFASDYDAEDITVTPSGDTIVFTAKNYDQTFDEPVITNVSDNLTGVVSHTTANASAVAQKETYTLSGTAAAVQRETMALTCTPHTKMKVTIPLTGTLPVKQKETITITGSSGTFTVTGTGGFTNVATWRTSEDVTATDFVTLYAAEYATAGVVVTANLHTIIFEAAVAGVPFVAPICTDGTADLHGAVEHTTANVAAGTANLTVVGLDPKLITFNTNIATTISDFVALWDTEYYASHGITLTGSATAIILESTEFGVPFGIPDVVTLTGNLAHGSIEQTVAYVATGVGTITGLGSPRTITFATSVDATAAAWVAANLDDYAAAGINLTASTNTIIFEADVAGTGFTSPTLVNSAGDMAGEVTVNQANVEQGLGTITALGESKTITFDTDAATTALNFKNANAAYYATLGVTLTNSTNKIVFTAAVAGVPFTTPVFTNTGGDLAGVLATTATDHYDNVTAQKQVETVLVTGSTGSFTISAAGGLTRVVTFTTNIQATIADFVTDNATAYDGQNIVLTGTATQIVFTAKTAGTGFTAPTISGITDNLAGTVATTDAVSIAPLTLTNIVDFAGGSGVIKEIKVETNSTVFATKKLRLWLFNAIPSGVVADNAAYVNLTADSPKRMANPYIEVTFEALVANSTTVIGKAQPNAYFTCVDRNMYIVIQSVDAVTTPASGAKFNIDMVVEKL